MIRVVLSARLRKLAHVDREVATGAEPFLVIGAMAGGEAKSFNEGLCRSLG